MTDDWLHISFTSIQSTKLSVSGFLRENIDAEKVFYRFKILSKKKTQPQLPHLGLYPYTKR